MARRRDFKAEYRQRIARGLRRGLTRRQARGHPGPGEPFVSGVSGPKYEPRLELGVRRIREGHSLTGMARSLHVDPERLRRYALETGVVEKRGWRLVVIDDDRLREVLTYSRGKDQVIVLRGYEEAAKWGRYMSGVGHFLDTNDPAALLPFEDDGLTDIHGRFWPFETRPNVLYRLGLTPEDTYELIYRIVA